MMDIKLRKRVAATRFGAWGYSTNLNELSKSGLDRVYNMIDLNEDGTIDTNELL